MTGPNDTHGSHALSIVDAIARFPAHGAIFTTFTLSLTWFERYILPALERARARRILLLADPLGVAESTHERLARGPGVRYALDVASAAGGVFHAKVAVLWGADCLLLAVGSGNLTFAGMQRNLEVWEVFTAGAPDLPPSRELNREVAEGALEFLANLARGDCGVRAKKTLDEATVALRHWIPQLPSNADVLWCDTFRGAIGDQFTSTARTRSKSFESLSVLAPFHDPTGQASAELARRLGATRLQVLFTGNETAYPFDSPQHQAGLVVSTARLTAAGSRPLHAKVLCAGGDGSVVLSGSPNATNQALWTTKNVEAAIIRWKGAADLAFLQSEPAVPAGRARADEFTDPNRLLLAWARFRGGTVQFKLVVAGEAPPTALFARVLGEAPSAETELPHALAGEHELPYEEFDPLQLKPARLEIRARFGEAEESTRCWISFDEFLDKSIQYRIALHAWNRLLAGDLDHEADEDDSELLNVFAQEHARVLGALAAPGAAVKGTTDADAEPAPEQAPPVPLQLLEAMANSVAASTSHRAPHGGGWVDQVLVAMRSAFQLPSGAGSTGRIRIAGDDESDADYERRLPTRVRQALEAFEEELLRHARAVRVRPPNPDAVLQYAVLCARVVLRYRSKESDNAPLWQSLASIAGAFLLPAPAQERGPLLLLLKGEREIELTILRTFAFLLGLLARQRGLLQATVDRRVVELGALREALAVLDLAAGTPVRPLPLPEVLAPLEIEADEVEGAINVLREVEAPSERARRLKADILAVLGGATLPERERPSIEKSVMSAVLRGKGRVTPLFVRPWITRCPKCGRILATSTLPALARFEPVQCSGMGCARWLIPSEAS